MHAKRTDIRSDPMPVITVLVIAAVSIAGILFETLGSGNGSHDSSVARMITNAAVARAGAIEIPSGPPAGQAAS